jgi:glycosyltransferase involved in cell wall biosynthesis
MRIAVVYSYQRKIGGIETYLDIVIPALVNDGHALSYWFEIGGDSDLQRISLPDDVPAWCVDEIGAEQALNALRDWKPDLIYSHGLLDPLLEARVLEIAPAVIFIHGYYGTCISGNKSFRFPVVQPCSRRFGWQCLVHYFPHRCGGLNPVTMLKLYGLQTKRLENLHRYKAIVTHSDHMLSDLIKHGLSPRDAHNLPYYVQSPSANEEADLAKPAAFAPSVGTGAIESQKVESQRGSNGEWHLLFSGRMEHVKGAHVFMDALPKVSAALNKPVRVTFAGDGRARQGLERRAARARSPKLKIEFVGWVERQQIEALLKTCDLLVVPSLWPEPFGLVGPEAGHFGVPVAAFDVGGIHDWLTDGVNGYLASGTPPTSSGLAQAIFKCLRDAETHARLRAGAVEVSRQYNLKDHLTALLEVFKSVIEEN